MMKPGFKPRSLWYLPPIIAGGFFVLVTAVFSPAVTVIFGVVCIPFSALAYYFGYAIPKQSFNKSIEEAKSWGWIACAWVTVIAWYLISSLFWCELIGC